MANRFKDTPLTGMTNRFKQPLPEPEDQGGGVLDTVLDVVSTPGRMTAGAISALQEGAPIMERVLANRPTIMGGTREDDFDDVLANAGVKDSFGRRAAGFALDVVVDPLNFVPVGPALKLGAKALGPVVDAVKGTRVAQDLAEKFVPYAGLNRFKANVGGQELSYKDLRRLHNSMRDAAREDAGFETLEMFRETIPRAGILGKVLGPKFKNITPDEAYKIAKALDEGTTLTDPRLEKMRAAAKARFDQQFAKEVAAGVMPPDARRIDYVTHLLTEEARRDPVNVRALSGKNPFQTRKDLSFEQGVRAGLFEPDIRKIMSTRLAVGDRAILNQQFFAQTAELFGVKVPKGQAPPKGYVKPQLAAEPGLKKALRGVYLPAEIVKDLEKMVELPKQAGRLAELASGATALWKGYATRTNPGFHTRNAVSNMLQTWFGGLGDTGTKLLDPFVIIKKHADAARLLADQSKIPDIGRYTGQEIREALHRYGVIGGHTSFNELDDIIAGEIAHAGQGFVRRNLNPLDRRNVALRAGARVGNAVENTSRLALFLDQIEKGATLEQAALHVRKYLFDYSELTDFERKLRDRAVPFYTWLRKNIPLQVENILTQPDKYAVLAKGFDSIEDTTQDRGLALSADEVPEWMRDYIQLPFQSDEGAAVFVNPNLPVQDINKLVPSPQKDIFAALNPIARIPAELALNRQFFTESPIYDEKLGMFQDFRRAPDLLQAAGKLMPGVLPESEKGVEIPAIADYAIRQFPPTTQFGKLAAAMTSEEEENLAGMDLDLLTLGGLPARVVDDKQARIQRKMRRNDEKARKRAQRKEKRRLKKSEVSSLYQRYLSEQ